jgi:hypothetical protein
MVRMVYWDERIVPTVLSLKLPKLLDGTLEEFEKAYEAKVVEIEQKLDADQMTEDEFLLQKRAEFPDAPPTYMGVSIQEIHKFAFTFTHNQFYRTVAAERKVEIFALLIDRHGKYTLIDHAHPRMGKIVRYKNNSNDPDNSIVIQTQRLSSETVVVLFGMRLPGLVTGAPFTTHSRYGVMDYHN